MKKGTATHKQIKKLNEKAKTRKALEDVQRAPREVYHALPKRKSNSTSYCNRCTNMMYCAKNKVCIEANQSWTEESPFSNIASWPGFNHFGRKRKKALGKKYKALIN